MTASTTPRERWIEKWDPEDEEFWERDGKRIARRNLVFSILAEHIGFSIWVMWSTLVLFMGDEYGVDPAGKFLLVAVPSFVGSCLRVPYTLAVAWFGGRNWTILSAAMLLLPTMAAAVVMEPGVSYSTLMIVAALAGFGGGNFSSSMANINTFYPERLKGSALGLNAGGGNLGVASIQLVGLLVIATAGTDAPRLLLGVYAPLIIVAAVCAALFMNNIASVRNDTSAAKDAVRDRQLWIMSFLYIGTFGSFIGYSFAFGLVLQNQFDRTPLEAASVTFVGPLLGSLIRPVGGWISDRVGGSRVTFWNFVAQAVGVGVIIYASDVESLALFTVGFIGLFVLTGIGNGSTYKMIPSIFRAKAELAVAAGAVADEAYARARRIASAAVGIIGAIGALGGVFINVAFRQSFEATGSGMYAYWTFLGFYVVCAGVTYAAYLRRVPVPAAEGTTAPAKKLALEGV